MPPILSISTMINKRYTSQQCYEDTDNSKTVPEKAHFPSLKKVSCAHAPITRIAATNGSISINSLMAETSAFLILAARSAHDTMMVLTSCLQSKDQSLGYI